MIPPDIQPDGAGASVGASVDNVIILLPLLHILPGAGVVSSLGISQVTCHHYSSGADELGHLVH